MNLINFYSFFRLGCLNHIELVKQSLSKSSFLEVHLCKLTGNLGNNILQKLLLTTIKKSPWWKSFPIVNHKLYEIIKRFDFYQFVSSSRLYLCTNLPTLDWTITLGVQLCSVFINLLMTEIPVFWFQRFLFFLFLESW